MSKEPALDIVLGPPSESDTKEIFDSFQRHMEHSGNQGSRTWEEYEKKLCERLFKTSGDGPTTIDKLFTKLFNVPTRIVDYSIGIGRHRGVWVVVIRIPGNGVLFQKPGIPWPPTGEHIDSIASALGFILKRDWIVAYSIIY